MSTSLSMIVCLWQMLASTNPMAMESVSCSRETLMKVPTGYGVFSDKSTLLQILALSSQTHARSHFEMVQLEFLWVMPVSKEFEIIAENLIYSIDHFTMHVPMCQMLSQPQQFIRWESEMSVSRLQS